MRQDQFFVWLVVDDKVLARKRLDELFQGNSELFPVGFSKGYAFNGHTKLSVKHPRNLPQDLLADEKHTKRAQ